MPCVSGFVGTFVSSILYNEFSSMRFYIVPNYDSYASMIGSAHI